MYSNCEQKSNNKITKTILIKLIVENSEQQWQLYNFSHFHAAQFH